MFFETMLQLLKVSNIKHLGILENILKAYESLDTDMKISIDAMANRGYKEMPRSLVDYFIQKFDIRAKGDPSTSTNTDDTATAQLRLPRKIHHHL